MDLTGSLESITLFFDWVINWLLTANLVAQATLVVISFIAAAYISRYVRQNIRLAEREKQLRPVARFYYRFIRRIAFPTALILLLWVGMLAFLGADEAYQLISKAISLSVAWLLIRMGSTLISNPMLSRTATLIIWVITALYLTNYLQLTTGWLDGISLDGRKEGLTVYDLIVSSLSVAAFVYGALALSRITDSVLHNKSGLSPSAQALISKVVKFTLLGVAALIGLSVVGIDLTAFAVFGGAIAVGIGLGLQKVFSNLIAGIILLSDNSIKPGDTIVSAGRYGKVNRLSARYISMITRDGIEFLIPNDELINTRVENWSHSDENVRMKCPIGIHYKADLHLAIQLCIEAARETPRVLKFPKPVCLLKGFGDSSVDLELRFWIRDPMNGCSNVKSEVLLKVWDKFHENQIEIPYPQRDIHIRTQDITATSQQEPSQSIL